MAWRCSGRTNAELVDNLHANGIIQSKLVLDAFHQVDRKNFVPEGSKDLAYMDSPQGIGYNVTISAPHMHAHAAELLCDHVVREDARVLDVGSGTGILLALFAAMQDQCCIRNGRLLGIEHVDDLARLSERNITAQNPGWLTSGKIRIVSGDGRQGIASEAPFDAIHVGAASPKVPHDLIAQLKVGGRLICPVGTSAQALMQYERLPNGQVEGKALMDVVYVPLTDRNSQYYG